MRRLTSVSESFDAFQNTHLEMSHGQLPVTSNNDQFSQHTASAVIYVTFLCSATGN